MKLSLSISTLRLFDGLKEKWVKTALLVTACVSLCQPVFSIEPQGQSDQGGPAWATVQKLVQAFKSGGEGPENLIDFAQIARRSVGQSQWQSLSQAERRDLTATIEALVQNRYFPRWKKIFGKGEVTYLSQSRKNGDILVATNLSLGHKDDPLTFQLTTSPLKVVSLTVNKNDLVTKLASRVQAHQAKGGYKAMIAWLKTRGKSDIADGETRGSEKVSEAPLKTSARPGDELF